jgi:TfoX/Sxy family transcriptional regulator of competence genes
MSYNHDIERRIDAALETFPPALATKISKKKMFGGLAYLYSGKMTVGVMKGDLMVRVISDKIDTALRKEFVRPMDFTNRPMKEFIYVSTDGFKTGTQLLEWIELGLEHARKVLKEQ